MTSKEFQLLRDIIIELAGEKINTPFYKELVFILNREIKLKETDFRKETSK